MDYKLFKLLQAVELLNVEIEHLKNQTDQNYLLFDLDDANVEELIYCWNQFKGDNNDW